MDLDEYDDRLMAAALSAVENAATRDLEHLTEAIQGALTVRLVVSGDYLTDGDGDGDGEPLPVVEDYEPPLIRVV